MRLIATLFGVLGLFAVGSRAQCADRMSGYALEDFPEFEKQWKQVTVRYRRDTGELRFVYANDIAYRTLAAGKTDFPEGSIFAKIGMASKEDRLFPSSAVPGEIKRFQFMVKSKKNGASTNGWAYAIFDRQGKALPEPKPAQVKACYACHQLANSRGDVFSELMEARKSLAGPPPPWLAGEISGVRFDEIPMRLTPKPVAQIIPAQFSRILSLQGVLRAHLFQGTLDEVRPTLAKEALEKKLPAALISESGDQFSLVVPTADSCVSGSAEGFWMITYTSVFKGAKGNEVSQIKFCQVK
jgi:hypothetical protein